METVLTYVAPVAAKQHASDKFSPNRKAVLESGSCRAGDGANQLRWPGLDSASACFERSERPVGLIQFSQILSTCVRIRIAGIASGIGREVMALSTVKYGPLLLALLLVASPVRAQLGHNWTICINGNSTFAPDEVIGACTDLIKTSNGRPSSLYAALTNRGSSFYDKRQYDRAIADHTAAIKLNLKDSTAYNNRGNAYKAEGEVDRAIADFNEAIRINPRSAVAYFNRAIAYALRRELDRAIVDINDAVRLSPKNAEYFDMRGMIFEARGDIDRARANFIMAQQVR
jgi:tetratricopeptide (TPR) repeat protein